MNHPYARPLNSKKLVEDFLEFVLGVDSYKDSDLINKIKSSEAELKNYDKSSPTISSSEHRVREYRSDSERWKLRESIVEELFTMTRMESDDDICLGKGGAIPTTELQYGAKAFIVTGLPASGKSGVANKIADANGAIILDSDYAKRKLPEFKDDPAGASLVHDESDALISGFTEKEPDTFKPLARLACEKKANIVIPKIGHFHESIIKQAKALKENYGYDVHLTLVSLDRRKATIRALERFKKYGRYVPLSLVFDGYSNDPILTYYRIKNFHRSVFASLGKISTDVPKGADPKIIDCDGDSNPACLFGKSD